MARPFTTIRDPVYDYIYITPIERDIIDRPEVQRLRFVLQNSSAYLTYPSNNNSRFLHSLGVMHLAGELFLNAMENAPAPTLSEFLSYVDKYLLWHLRNDQWDKKELINSWDNVLGDAAGCVHHPREGLTASLSENDRLLINILWQSVRLAALMHDVGHFPLSHLFERAFANFFTFCGDQHNFMRQEYIRRFQEFRASIGEDLAKEELPPTDHPILDMLKEYPLHEMWGAILFHGWLPRHITDTRRLFYNVIFHLAKLIIVVRPDVDGPADMDSFRVFRCLHSLIAGELDADRLDYCVRDPLSSGLEFGAIDVKRIVRSMTLYKDHGHNRFMILPEARALSALESFFHQRYLIYQYLIYHHNVLRFDGIAQEIIWRFLDEAATNNRGPLDELLDDFGLWTARANEQGFHFLSRGFEHYDDAWLRTLMSQCLLILKSNDSLPQTLKSMVVLLETFLYRQTRNVVSMWKREADYNKTCDEIYSELCDRYHGKAMCLDDIHALFSVGAETVKLYDTLFAPIKQELLQENVVMVYRVMNPKVPEMLQDEDRELKVLVGENPQSFRRVSSYLVSLSKKKPSPSIFIAFVANNLKDTPDLAEKCKKTVIKHLIHYMTPVFNEKMYRDDQSPITARVEVTNHSRLRKIISSLFRS